MFNSILFLLLLAGCSSLSFAQHIQIQGKVIDSLKNPLPYANILAIPIAEDLEVRFAKNNTGLNVNIHLINHKLNLQNQTKKC